MTSIATRVKIGEGEAPYRRITVDVGRLVWSNHPLHVDDHVVVEICGTETVLRFDNGRKGRPKKAEFDVTKPISSDQHRIGFR